MMDQFIALILDEGKWLFFSMSLAFIAIIVLFFRHRHSDISNRSRILAAMNLFFGVTIGSMAFGHFLAITVKLLLGTLEGSTLLFYLIGIILAVPSWWLILHTRQILKPDNDHGRMTLILNTWLAASVLALGLHNLPLAMPGFFNIGYHLHSRRSVGWAIVAIALIINLGLFIGSLIFMASGQSFEQFQGIE